MMSLPPSSSDSPADVFERLHPEVQRWIWDKGWSSLRDIQANAIETILSENGDALIAASTASGKTEAAFLPILSVLAGNPQTGVRAMYVGPLKALINDQFQRLEDLCERLKITVTKWHGDASSSAKRRLREHSEGVLLITPESLEAMFVRRPESLEPMFRSLAFVVIDELHAFLDSERGVQLASLLKRLDTRTGVRPRRVGLSATIGDLSIAAAWLSPGNHSAVRIIESHAVSAPLQLQIRGVRQPDEDESEAGEGESRDEIAEHLFKIMRGKGNHLIFAGSRRNTEALSDRLRTMCDEANVPNEFFPHHGNLSKETREALETRLKGSALPTTAVCTTTLELGIDIGSVESVAQIGAPASISSFRQRLGRSGRREGSASVVRIYVPEQNIDARSNLFSRLRIETVQAVAAVQLLLRRWVEPPQSSKLHFSTLLHQTLSLIVERGGAQAQQAFKQLGGAGPFDQVQPTMFVELLRAMSAREEKLIEQASDGTLMLGKLGERLTGNYDFYSVFVTYDEYAIVTESKTLGTLSVTNALGPGDYLIFAGQRWQVREIDDHTKRVLVDPAPAGRVPRFEGEAAPLHDRLLEEMHAVYLADDLPQFLNAAAKDYLVQGREEFRSLGLDKQHCTVSNQRIYLFPWIGTQKLDTLRLALRYCGLQVEQSRIAVSVALDNDATLRGALEQLVVNAPSPDALALMSETLRSAKYDYLLSDELLRFQFGRNQLDFQALAAVCKLLCDERA